MKTQITPVRFIYRRFVKRTKPRKYVGTAQDASRHDVIHLLKARKCAFEIDAAKRTPQTHFAPYLFQVCFLRRRNRDAVPAQILDGRAVAAELRAELAQRSTALREAGIHPRLVVALVGEDESSVAYVRNLVKTGERVGIAVHVDELPSEATASQVRERFMTPIAASRSAMPMWTWQPKMICSRASCWKSSAIPK